MQSLLKPYPYPMALLFAFSRNSVTKKLLHKLMSKQIYLKTQELFPVSPSLLYLLLRIKRVLENVHFKLISLSTETACRNNMNWYMVITWISREKSQALHVQSELLQPKFLFQRDVISFKRVFLPLSLILHRHSAASVSW